MDIYFIVQKSALICEGLALLFSLIYIKKYFNTPAKLIPFYLFFVFGVELVSISLAFDNWMFNLLGVLELFVFTYIFYFTVKGKSSKKIIVSAFLGCILALVIDAVFITKSIFTFLAIAFGFTSLGIVIMCFVYLLELAKTEKVVHQNRILLYWVVIGLLFFHLCNLPVTVVTNDIFDIGRVNTILLIQVITALAMYMCYIIGFIWSRKEYNY